MFWISLLIGYSAWKQRIIIDLNECGLWKFTCAVEFGSTRVKPRDGLEYSDLQSKLALNQLQI